MPNKSPLVTFFLYLCLPHHLESFSPLSHHCLCSIRHYSTSIWSSLARINSIITISICLSTWIHSDCLYHAGISLILTLLSCSTSIEPWDKSTLTPTTTNCLTWAPAYRSAPPPPYFQQCGFQCSKGVVTRLVPGPGMGLLGEIKEGAGSIRVVGNEALIEVCKP